MPIEEKLSIVTGKVTLKMYLIDIFYSFTLTDEGNHPPSQNRRPQNRRRCKKYTSG